MSIGCQSVQYEYSYEQRQKWGISPRLECSGKEMITDMNPKEQARGGWEEGGTECAWHAKGTKCPEVRERAVNSEN